MSFFNKFPFTTYEKINLDWLLTKMQECIDAVSNFVVDSVLDITSNHAISNKAVTTALNTKLTVYNGRVSYNNLDSNLQTAYNNANSALQSVPYTYRTATEQDVIDNAKQDKLFPNGLNIEDVNRFVCVRGIAGDGLYYTKNIGALYRSYTKYYKRLDGLMGCTFDNFKADELHLYLWCFKRDSGNNTADIIVTVVSDDGMENEFTYTLTNIITSADRNAVLHLYVMEHNIYCERRTPAAPTGSTGINSVNTNIRINSKYKYIKKIEIKLTNDNFGFQDPSYLHMEVRENV